MTHPPRICPQCNHPIPQGNQRCNLCGFNYREHLKKQAQSRKEPKKAIGSAISGLVLFLFILGFAIPVAGSFVSAFLEKISTGNLLELVQWMPVIMPLIFIILFAVIVAIVVINQTRK